MSYTQASEYNAEDYIRVFVNIHADYFEKETERAYCFRLWHKKFLAIPKSLIQDLSFDERGFDCSLPKWYLAQHNLKSIVIDEQKYLFPTKKEQLKAQQEREQGSLLTQLEELPQKPKVTVILLDHDLDDEF